MFYKILNRLAMTSTLFSICMFKTLELASKKEIKKKDYKIKNLGSIDDPHIVMFGERYTIDSEDYPDDITRVMESKVLKFDKSKFTYDKSKIKTMNPCYLYFKIIHWGLSNNVPFAERYLDRKLKNF